MSNITKYKIYCTQSVEQKESNFQGYDIRGCYINRDGIPFMYSYGEFLQDGNWRHYANITAIYKGYSYTVWLDYIPTPHSLKLQCSKLYKQIKII